MTRIAVSSSSTGPADITFGLNPVLYNVEDYSDHNIHESAFSNNFANINYLDYKERSLVWQNINMDNTALPSIISYLRTAEGTIKYVNFSTVDVLNDGWPNSNTWKKVFISNVSVSYARASRSGNKYSEVKIDFYPGV